MAARKFKEEITEWSQGVMVGDQTGDKVPKNAATRARNAAWLKQGFPSKRKGIPILTASAQSGQHPILNLGYGVGLNWVIDDLGRWSKYSGGVLSAIDVGHTTPFTAGTHIPSVALANNLMFAVNGIDAKKTDGTTVMQYGVSAPAAPTVVDSGIGGNPNGTYLFALTAYNSNTGAESNLSANTSVTVAAHKITVSWTFPTDPQVTEVRVHVFKNGLTGKFFQIPPSAADVTPAPDANGGYTSGTVSITVNLTDTDITNFLIASPSTTENSLPPAGMTFNAFHNGRMFGTDGKYLYYTKLNLPESWDPGRFEVVNTKDGQNIVAFISLSEQQMLILKDRSAYMLVGPNDPNTWEIVPLEPTVGITSFRTLVLTEGSVWWEALQGIFRVQYTDSGVSKPQRVDVPNISDRIENLNDVNITASTFAYDQVHQRLILGVPNSGDAVNSILLPFNTKIGVWEDTWDPMNVSALGVFIENNAPYVAIGGYKGRVFQVWNTPYVDGVRLNNGGGTNFTLTGNPTSATANTMTDTGATFDTAGDGLSEIPVVAVSASGQTQRAIIASNTGTVLTLTGNWGVIPDSTWTYYIGSPAFEVDTKHLNPTSTPGIQGTSFNMHTFKRLLVRGATDTGQATLDVYAMVDGDMTNFKAHVQIPISSGGAKWDIDQWDVGVFGSGNISTAHRGLGVRGHTCGLRFRNYTPNQGAIVLDVGVYGTEQGYKQ